MFTFFLPVISVGGEAAAAAVAIIELDWGRPTAARKEASEAEGVTERQAIMVARGGANSLVSERKRRGRADGRI